MIQAIKLSNNQTISPPANQTNQSINQSLPPINNSHQSIKSINQSINQMYQSNQSINQFIQTTKQSKKKTYMATNEKQSINQSIKQSITNTQSTKTSIQTINNSFKLFIDQMHNIAKKVNGGTLFFSGIHFFSYMCLLTKCVWSRGWLQMQWQQSLCKKKSTWIYDLVIFRGCAVRFFFVCVQVCMHVCM